MSIYLYRVSADDVWSYTDQYWCRVSICDAIYYHSVMLMSYVWVIHTGTKYYWWHVYICVYYVYVSIYIINVYTYICTIYLHCVCRICMYYICMYDILMIYTYVCNMMITCDAIYHVYTICACCTNVLLY